MTLSMSVCVSISSKGRAVILHIFKLIDTFATINLARHYVIKAFVNNIVSEV